MATLLRRSQPWGHLSLFYLPYQAEPTKGPQVCLWPRFCVPTCTPRNSSPVRFFSSTISSTQVYVIISLARLMSFLLYSNFLGTPQPGLKTSTLGLVSGHLVKTVKDNILCRGCLETVKAPSCCSLTTALTANIDRGGLCYPYLVFVGFIVVLEKAASTALEKLQQADTPLKEFLMAVVPAVAKNPVFVSGRYFEESQNDASHCYCEEVSETIPCKLHKECI